MDELEALVTLANIPYMGSVKVRQLLRCYGTASEACRADPKEISQIPGFAKVASAFETLKRNGPWKSDVELADKEGAAIIPFTDPLYPKRLLELPDHPILLYVKGKTANLNAVKSVAIVGTRQSSIYGSDAAEKIAGELSSLGFVVVSGLARGIDTAAHQGALIEKGLTLAVLGSGLSHIYPPENRALAEAIIDNGALISEFPMSAPPNKPNFPKRNRIVSGMTLGTLLIEAPIRSGAMLTMQNAKDQGRKMFAIPGRIDMENFCGNHHLIKTGQALLVENAEDVANSFQELFSLRASDRPSAKPKALHPLLEEEEEQLVKMMPATEANIDEIAVLTKLPIHKLNFLLMSLVLKKVIKEYPGKIYKLLK